MSNVKVFVHNTAQAAEAFQSSQCQALLQEAQLTASDLDRARVLFITDRNYFHQIFASRANFLGFSVAALVKSNGEIIDRVDVAKNASAIVIAPPQSEFDNARRGEPLCLMIDDGKSFVALARAPRLREHVSVRDPADRSAWRWNSPNRPRRSSPATTNSTAIAPPFNAPSC